MPTTFLKDGSEVNALKLLSIYRWIRKLPGGRTRKKLMNAYYEFTKWSNLRFYNLPKSLPSDFCFERLVIHDRKRIRKESRLIFERGQVTEARRYLVPKTKLRGREYDLLNETRITYDIHEDEAMELYKTIRSTGFIHFRDSNEDIEMQCGGSYELTAHGKTYVFIEYTVIHSTWEQNMIRLDQHLDNLKVRPVSRSVIWKKLP